MINEVFHEGIVVRTWKFADDLLFRLACHRDPDLPSKPLNETHVLLPTKTWKPECFDKEKTQWRRRQTLAMAAGLMFRRWTEKELLSYPLP